MGEVFVAHDAVLAREVAIKVLHRSLAGDQGFVDRFRREARAAATLNHPNIVTVFDWGAVDGIYYMVMELVQGRGFRHLLNARGRLEPAQAADVVRQTLLALEHAHGKGIVHRDLKPENMLVDQRGVVKLTDLGLARAYADGRATQAGTVTGTVQYLAPEQIRGEPADPRSDLYSLGVVMYELLTGKLPFAGETAMAIAYKHLSDRVPKPSSTVDAVPPDLDGFVASATERDRELRPESAAEMRRDLEQIAASLPPAPPIASLVADAPPIVDVRDPSAPEPDKTTITIPRLERRRRRGLRRALGAVFAIAALAAIAWGAWTYLVPHKASVPDVAGASVADATARLTDAGFTVRVAKGVYSLKVAEGNVVRLDPAPGTTLSKGAVVTIVPSLGAQPIPVPDVGGSTVADATKTLQRAGFTIAAEQQRKYSDTVPVGQVIATSPAGNTQAPEQSAVTLIVSRGPSPKPIPQVVGKTVDKAKAALGSLGFSATVVQKFSSSVDLDVVISVDPAEGARTAYGSAVTLTVSKGPQSFACPNFVGMSVADARALAESHGLHVSALPVPGATGTTVVSQIPDPGASVHYGDTIALYYA